jgi:hypothetical protein
VVLLLAGCGVQPSTVTDAGDAPTGVAPGVTLFFLDDQGKLRPQQRETGQLGTVAEAVTLLLDAGDPGAGLRSEITSDSVTRVPVTVTEDTIDLHLPITDRDVTPLGMDQIVCTALATHVRAGGSPRTAVRLYFTISGPGSDAPRTCPLINPGR